jgi:hypothetical protein
MRRARPRRPVCGVTPRRAAYTSLAFVRSETGCSSVFISRVEELLMVTPKSWVMSTRWGCRAWRRTGSPETALGRLLGDGATPVVGDAGVYGRRLQDDGRAGPAGGADRDPAHPALSDAVADLEASVSREKARDGSGTSCGRKVE